MVTWGACKLYPQQRRQGQWPARPLRLAARGVRQRAFEIDGHRIQNPAYSTSHTIKITAALPKWGTAVFLVQKELFDKLAGIFDAAGTAAFFYAVVDALQLTADISAVLLRKLLRNRFVKLIGLA